MLKFISICSALVILGTGAVSAQQQEAALKKLEVPGADFDIVVAMAKPAGAAFVQHGLPDPLLVNLAGTELVMAVDGEVEKMVKDVGLLLTQTCAISMRRQNGKPAKSVALYVVPKGDASTSPVR